MLQEVDEKKPVWRAVWFAILVCGLLLVVSLVPAVSEMIEKIDQRAAVWLNRAAGVSPVFDRFVLLVADEDGRERIVVLAIVAFLVGLWLAPSRLEKSRLLGTLLFVAAVLGVYFLIDGLLDDVIERKSPSIEFLNPFRDIAKILDGEADLTDKRSFPNAEGVILLTIGFILLRLRRLRGGLIAVGLGLSVPLLNCVAGLTWVTDIYLGALPIAFLISAVATETPFARLHGSLVDLSAAGFDEGERFARSLAPIWRHRRQYWTSQNVLHMEVAVKRFAGREVAGILDPEKQHGGEPVALEVPLGGLRSVVRIVTLGPLKAVLRAYPLSNRYEADQHFRASTLLKKHGVRVPEIYHRVESPRKYGALFIVEEFIDGRSKEPDELTDADLSAAAAEIARLHSITSEVWGPITAPRTEDYGIVLQRRIERQLGQVFRRQGMQGGQQGKVVKVRTWFNDWRSRLSDIRSFSLIHGKLHRENCLFETSGRFCLLDITTLEWGIATSDLVHVYYSQCGGRDDLIQRFNKLYFQELEPEEAARIRQFLPLFQAMHCLGQITKYRKRQTRSQRRSAGDAVAKEMHWWNQLLRIVEKDQAPAGD